MSKTNSFELASLTRQLASMLALELPLVESLEVLARSAPTARMRRALSLVKDGVQAGDRLSSSAERLPSEFPKYWVGLVRLGERSGRLSPILAVTAEIMRESGKVAGQLRRAFFRPAIICCLALFDVCLLSLVFVPNVLRVAMVELGRSTGRALPKGVAFVLPISYGLLLLPICLLALLLFIKWGRGFRFPDRLALNFPFWGAVLRQAYAALFARVTECLLKHGVSLPETLGFCAEVVENASVKDSLYLAKREVEAGGTLAQGLNAYPVFTPWVHWAVQSLEQKGQLAEGISEIAEQSQRRIRSSIEVFKNILEPFLGIFLGLGVFGLIYFLLFVVVSMFGNTIR